MPHIGPREVLIEACKALGFEVQPSNTMSIVMYEGSQAALISGDMLKVDSDVVEKLAGIMPAVTQDQGEAFDRVLSKLERDRIAIHEAGHAVAAYELGFNICYVSLTEANEMQLCSDCDPDSVDYDDVSKVEELQEVYAAGAAAERIVFGAERPHGIAKDCRDVNSMEIFKIQAKSGESPDNIDVFEEYAQRVQQHLTREGIEAVATQLKSKGILSGRAIEAILQDI